MWLLSVCDVFFCERAKSREASNSVAKVRYSFGRKENSNTIFLVQLTKLLHLECPIITLYPIHCIYC